MYSFEIKEIDRIITPLVGDVFDVLFHVSWFAHYTHVYQCLQNIACVCTVRDECGLKRRLPS